jgi:hypothetical protein
MLVIGLTSFFLSCFMTGKCCSQQRPTYEVARVTTPIKVDGQLSERAWIDSAPIASFLNNRDGSTSKVQTEARILYDDRFIYFAFRAVDKNIWATMKRRDEHLWLEEVVEVFLQANPAIPNYIELEVNPLGTMLDIYLIDTRKPLKSCSGRCTLTERWMEKKAIVSGLAKLPCRSRMLQLRRIFRRSLVIAGA